MGWQTFSEPDWENKPSGLQLSERLKPLGTTVAKLRDSLAHLERHSTMVLRGARGTPNWAPTLPRGASSSGSRVDFSQSRLLNYVHAV